MADFCFFFLKETGYEIQIDTCIICGKQIIGENVYYNLDKGVICGECTKSAVDIHKINAELLAYLKCLKLGESVKNFSNLIIQKAIVFMEDHLKYHIPDFKGISSLKLFN